MARIIKNLTSGPLCINDVKIAMGPGEVVDVDKHINMIRNNGISLDLDELVSKGVVEEIYNDKKDPKAYQANVQSTTTAQPVNDDVIHIIEKVVSSLSHARGENDASQNSKIEKLLSEVVCEIRSLKNYMGGATSVAHRDTFDQEPASTPTLDIGEITAQIHASRSDYQGALGGKISVDERDGEDGNLDDMASLLKSIKSKD